MVPLEQSNPKISPTPELIQQDIARQLLLDFVLNIVLRIRNRMDDDTLDLSGKVLGSSQS